MVKFTSSIKTLFAATFGVLLFYSSSYACACETYRVPRADAKQYYLKEFRGAIFTGTVKSIEHDPAKDSGGITYSKLLIDVDRYWLGVSKPETTVFVAGPNTSCWFDWKLGQKSFFIAKRLKGGLFYSPCDVLNWGGTQGSVEWEDYTKRVLGNSKRFRTDSQ